MARASTVTLLSIDRWGRIMGLNPAHLNGAAGASIMPVSGTCSDVWFQHSWQNADSVSREDLARAIYDAEEDIASILGYYPAPKWIAKEIHKYPRYHRRDVYSSSGRNVRGEHKSIIAKRGKFIQAGRRAVSLVDDAAAVTFSDPDGDGYNELATVTAATSLTDACEIKVYTTGKSGAQEWEIRPAKSKTVSGGNFTATFDAWQMINPTLWEALTTEVEGNRALDLTGSIYVSTVDIYREYTDFSQASAEFSWEPDPNGGVIFCSNCGGSGCLVCENTIQTGCLHVRDVERGILVPVPGTYDDDEDTWQGATFTGCEEPDTVKLWYRAGELDERYLRGETCEELSDYLAQTIAWLATARLERNICACNNAHALAADLRRDLAFTPSEGGSFILSDDDLANPFGTRKGEVMAWKRISKLVERLGVGVSV